MKKKRESVGFLEFFQKFLNNKKTRKENVNMFNSAFNHLNAFLHSEKKVDIDINSIDYNFVNSLDLYFKSHQTITRKGSLSNITINNYFLRYSIVYQEAQNHEHLFVKSENPFKLIKRKSIEVSGIDKDFNLEELRGYFEQDFSNDNKALNFSFEKVQDIHKFQFLIGGHDFEDISLLKWSDIKNDRIIFKRYKNKRLNYGGKEACNLLHPLALDSRRRTFESY